MLGRRIVQELAMPAHSPDPWRVIARSRLRLVDRAEGALIGILLAAVGVCAVAGLSTKTGPGDIANGRGWVPVAWALVALGVIVTSLLAGRRWSYIQCIRRTQTSARAAWSGLGAPLASAREAVVRLRGQIVAGRSLRSIDGEECLAWALADVAPIDGDWQVSGGVLFDVIDESGVKVRVDATHILIVEGKRVGREIIVPVQADVEIVGEARWGDDPEGAQEADYRAPPRTLTMTGTPERPLLVRARAPRSGARCPRPQEARRRHG
jgi:hypothetical protein